MGSALQLLSYKTHSMAILLIATITLSLFNIVSGGSVCTSCVSFGSEWPPPCFEKDVNLQGNDLKLRLRLVKPSVLSSMPAEFGRTIRLHLHPKERLQALANAT